ncbi:MAG: hypothetical protein ACRETY_13790 [Steroidobacteraceae bacterium]
MKKQDRTKWVSSPVGEILQGISREAPKTAAPVRKRVRRRCKDCRVDNAFHAYVFQHLVAAGSGTVSFSKWNIPPPGKRAVIELVTARIVVPSGEWVRLRMNTVLHTSPSNLDLVVTPQGVHKGKQNLSATHAVRVYSDDHIQFTVERDNFLTEGDALVCISGYFMDT